MNRTSGVYLYYEFSKYGGLVITLFNWGGDAGRRTIFFSNPIQFYEWLFEVEMESVASAMVALQDHACMLLEIGKEHTLDRFWSVKDEA